MKIWNYFSNRIKWLSQIIKKLLHTILITEAIVCLKNQIIALMTLHWRKLDKILSKFKVLWPWALSNQYLLKTLLTNLIEVLSRDLILIHHLEDKDQIKRLKVSLFNAKKPLLKLTNQISVELLQLLFLQKTLIHRTGLKQDLTKIRIFKKNHLQIEMKKWLILIMKWNKHKRS